MKGQFYHSSYQADISIFAGGSTLRVWGPVLWQVHIVKLSLLFKDTVDLQGQIFWNFFFLYFFFFFHVKRSIAITTIISEKRFEKYRKERELFTKTNFRKKCVF